MTGSANSMRHLSNITYEDFRTNHLLINQPVMIAPTLVQEWPCRSHWRLPSRSTLSKEDDMSVNNASAPSSEPNFGYIKDKYGHLVVPVDEEGCRTERPLQDILALWEKGEGRGMYVKDWHLALQLSRQKDPSISKFYDTPNIFKDDWMNRYYLKETQDDFRFVVSQLFV
jgi:hypothetical protein